ncbi:MAG: hypothetical protein PW734_12605 [Verrucomicrobium sp.]|nr:hypothetical protein [Verrucomicrobium sp.]
MAQDQTHATPVHIQFASAPTADQIAQQTAARHQQAVESEQRIRKELSQAAPAPTPQAGPKEISISQATGQLTPSAPTKVNLGQTQERTDVQVLYSKEDLGNLLHAGQPVANKSAYQPEVRPVNLAAQAWQGLTNVPRSGQHSQDSQAPTKQQGQER